MAYQKKRRKKELWSPENSETQTGMLEMEKETHRTVTALRSTWVNSSINSLKWQFLQNCPQQQQQQQQQAGIMSVPRLNFHELATRTENRATSPENRESRIENQEPRIESPQNPASVPDPSPHFCSTDFVCVLVFVMAWSPPLVPPL